MRENVAFLQNFIKINHSLVAYNISNLEIRPLSFHTEHT